MSAEGGSIRILVVDDHSLVREGIATFIAGQPVGVASPFKTRINA